MDARRMVRSSEIAVCALLALTLLSACGFIVPQSTKTNGETSDGVSGQIAGIYVANAVLIRSGDVANLVVSLVNESNTDVDLEIRKEVPPRSCRVHAAARSVTELGTPGHQVVILANLTASNSDAGALYPVVFSYGDRKELRLDVPVLSDAQPQYRNLSPTDVR